MKEPVNLEMVNLRNIDRKKVEEDTQAVKHVLSWIHTKQITETNLMVLVGENVIAEFVGTKRSKH